MTTIELPPIPPVPAADASAEVRDWYARVVYMHREAERAASTAEGSAAQARMAAAQEQMIALQSANAPNAYYPDHERAWALTLRAVETGKSGIEAVQIARSTLAAFKLFYPNPEAPQ